MKTYLIIIFLLFAGAVNAQTKVIPENNTDDPIFTVAEHNPEYPGGIEAFYKFVTQNLKWPATSKDLTGKIFITFVVEKDGQLSHYNILKGLNADLNKEALRVIKLTSGKWKPGVQNKHIVRVQYVVPISLETNQK